LTRAAALQLPSELDDTLAYTGRNLDRTFRREADAQVLLLVPEFLSGSSFLQPPLCMMNVYMKLRDMGIASDVLDNRVFGYSFAQVLEIAKDYECIAVTSSPVDQVQNYFTDYRYILFCDLVNYLKGNLTDSCTIIVCGAHTSVKWEWVMAKARADIALLGEYDFQLVDVVARSLSGQRCDTIPNVVVRDSEKGYIKTPIDEDLKHPSEWCSTVIDYSVLPVEDYFGYQYLKNMHAKRRGWSIAQSSRGCAYSCTFCYNFYGRKVRFREINCLIAELKQLSDLGVNEVFFIDQTFTYSKPYVTELCNRMIRENVALTWSCETRADLVDPGVLECMRSAGCHAIWVGVESFNNDALKRSKKGVTAEQIHGGLKCIDSSGIESRVFIMLGMKGDSPEGLSSTIDVVERNGIRLSKSIIECSPRLGTALYDELRPEQKASIDGFVALNRYRGKLSDELSDDDVAAALCRLLRLADAETRGMADPAKGSQ
jgi:radical SAM superfamily enzyme YgiQ (UPF0313 family)